MIQKTSLEQFLPVNPDAATALIPASGYCPESRIRSAHVVNGVELDVSRVDFVSPCNRWRCPVCGPKKRWKLINRIALGKPNKFMTLTVKPLDGETPREAFVRTAKRVSKLIAWLRKRDADLAYARILESTKKGFPHYHFCARMRFVPQRELAEKWRAISGANVVDIRAIKGKTVSYVAKYVTKSDAVSYTRQRISFSRNWPKVERRKRDEHLAEWSTVHNDEIPAYVGRCLVSGKMRDLGPSCVGLADDFEESQVLRQLETQFGSELKFKTMPPRDYVLNPREKDTGNDRYTDPDWIPNDDDDECPF